MKVSVIISTKNRKSLLKRLIKNLTLQEYIPDEVIIVEAGEIDWTSEMFTKSMMNINFIKARKTSLSEAREIERKASKNELLIFLDDDIILPENYINTAREFLTKNDKILGVGGIYEEKNSLKEKKWKKVIGRMLGIYSNGSQNKILKSGWADYVRGDFIKKETSAEWLFGCNWAIKAKAFHHEKVKIETNLAQWSFLEDVIIGYRLINNYGDCLKLLPRLKVHHDPLKSSGEISSETIKMRILYRFVFWKYELNTQRKNTFSFLLGMIANTLLMINQRPSFNTIFQCFYAYYLILITPPKSYKACNDFIFNK